MEENGIRLTFPAMFNETLGSSVKIMHMLL